MDAFKAAKNLSEGVTVSGTVTSFGSETDEVTIELIKKGETKPAYSKAATGNSAEYSIAGVAAGEYTLRVSKKGNATFTESLKVETTQIDKDIAIRLWGDVNRDGNVTAADAQEIQRYAAGLSSVFDTDENKDYCKACADVNNDSIITAADAQEIQRYAAGLSSTINSL